MKLKYFRNFMNDEKPNPKHEKWIIAISMIILFAMLIIALIQPDNGPSTIKKLLGEQGYIVDGIEFEKISGNRFRHRERMYQSSTSIEYESGVFVDKWILTDTSFSNYISSWVVTPYPPLLSEPVNFGVEITMSRGQLQALEKKLNGMSMEQYINKLLQQITEEKQVNE